MMIPTTDYEWLEPAAFQAAAAEVLSLLVLLPRTEDSDSPELLRLQHWLHGADLLRFDDPGRKSNGEAATVVCKHVHVPGLGPEVRRPRLPSARRPTPCSGRHAAPCSGRRAAPCSSVARRGALTAAAAAVQVDISPVGVNKGSAIKVLLQDLEAHLGVRLAVGETVILLTLSLHPLLMHLLKVEGGAAE